MGARNFRGRGGKCQRPIKNRAKSDIEAEMQDIAFLDHVLLAFQAQAAGIPGPGFALDT